MIVPLGDRTARKSVAAIKAASTQATVVKKPNAFWMRVKELCMVVLYAREGAREAFRSSCFCLCMCAVVGRAQLLGRMKLQYMAEEKLFWLDSRG